jgi:hypothetical protein
MRWAGHVACMVEIRNAYKRLIEKNLKGRDHLEDLVIVEKIVLEWILEKQCGKLWTGFIWLRTGTNSALL